MFHVKILDSASFSLWLFVVHVPPVFIVLLTYSLKINSLLFDPPCMWVYCDHFNFVRLIY